MNHCEHKRWRPNARTELSFRRPCFSFRLTDRSTFGKFFLGGEPACKIRESGSESARETTANSRVQLH